MDMTFDRVCARFISFSSDCTFAQWTPFIASRRMLRVNWITYDETHLFAEPINDFSFFTDNTSNFLWMIDKENFVISLIIGGKSAAIVINSRND